MSLLESGRWFKLEEITSNLSFPKSDLKIILDFLKQNDLIEVNEEKHIFRLNPAMINLINKLEKMQGSTPVKDEPKTRQTKIKKEDKKKDNPRSGEFESKDVEIDKIFYFGNK